jgi:glutamine synthetase
MELHGNVVFGGDGYSAEWHKMAVEERGLKNIPTTADALPALLEDSVKALFESTGVLTPVELQSRYEVYSEQYILSIEVEAKLVIDIATTSLYPAAISYLSELTDTIAISKEVGIDLDNSVATSVAADANNMMASVAKLRETIKTDEFSSIEEHMQYCANDIRSLMDEVRTYADSLEMVVADELWPLPKYAEMLFIK